MGFGTGIITGSGNITGGNIIGIIAAGSNTITTTGNANVGNLGFGTGIITGTGNITAGNIIGVHANGNSNVNIPTANGNVYITAVGNTTAVITGTGVNVFGTLNTTGNVLFTSSNVTLGSNANVKITGGTAGYSLTTDGSGNLSWANPTSALTTAIQQFTATAAQSVFTVSGGYTVGSVIVFVNGIQLNDGDYTALNGTTITLTEARNAGDIVRVIVTLASVNLATTQLRNFSVAMSIALSM